MLFRSTLHRPLTANQQQFVQKTVENQGQDETREFINQLGEYPPTIPDSVTMHFLKSAGVEGTDPRVTRMIALAAQKHISDIVLDAMQNVSVFKLWEEVLLSFSGTDEGSRPDEKGN